MKGGKLLGEYKAALESYVRSADEAALSGAYEVGRRALVEGMGVMDLAAFSHRALIEALKAHGTGSQSLRILEAAQSVFAEALTPFEMTHRGYQEAVVALRRLNETLEEEIKRIAHRLHAEAGQLLAVVHLALDDLARDLEPAALVRVRQVREFLDQIQKNLRDLSHELHPTVLDDLGLIPALEFLANGVSQRTRLAIVVESDKPERLPAAVETALYRIVQEALSNVTKHARAGKVKIEVRRETGQLVCPVRDDGIGFDVPQALSKRGERGLGLIGIRERLNPLGGQLEITSTPGGGTQLRMTIPLKN